jgi:hypothetical protein
LFTGDAGLAAHRIAATLARSDTTGYCAQFAPMHTEFKAFASIRTFVWAAWVIAASDVCAVLVEALDRTGGLDDVADAALLELPAESLCCTVSAVMFACASSSCASGFLVGKACGE